MYQCQTAVLLPINLIGAQIQPSVHRITDQHFVTVYVNITAPARSACHYHAQTALPIDNVSCHVMFLVSCFAVCTGSPERLGVTFTGCPNDGSAPCNTVT
jgi:hypothetical protein